MHFALILAILSVVGVAESGLQTPVGHGAARAALLALAGAGIALAAVAIAHSTVTRLGRDFARRNEIMDRFARLRTLHTVAWLVVSVAGVTGLGWARVVRYDWHLERALLVDDLLLLTPLIVPLLLSWGAFHAIDRRLCLGSNGPAACLTLSATRASYVLLHARHYLGIVLVPVLWMLFVQDAARLFLPRGLDDPRAAAVQLAGLLAVVALLPFLLRGLWNTTPLAPGALRTRLFRTARRCGVHVREILVLDTGGRVLNAAVTGFLPGTRYVFLTDGLLHSLSDAEVEATFAHELGHIRHRHLLLRLMAIFLPLLLGSVLLWLDGPKAVGQWWGLDASAFRLVLLAAGLLGMTLYTALVFAPYSRLLEIQADWYVIQSMDRAARHESLETFLSALRRLSPDQARHSRAQGWLHPSLAVRAARLRRLEEDPRSLQRFGRLLGWVNGVLIMSFVVGLLAWAYLG